MNTTRREFLRMSAMAGAALGLGSGLPSQLHAAPGRGPAAKPLKILILGGTGYLGPQLVEYARARGHTVTLFNRAKSRPEMFPDVERLIGDRDPNIGEGLNALKGRAWDAAIDTSGHVPRTVRASATLLGETIKHYTFISSLSAFAGFPEENMDESAPVATMEDETVEDVRRFFGPMKALCEKAAEESMPGRVANIRPGLIAGPGDWSDRFTYWPIRVSRGGEVLAPGTPQDKIQFIDVRDLAEWTIHVVENNVTGLFNANGPKFPYTIGELMQACKKATGSDATFTWVDAAFLEANGVAPWQHMPAWIPAEGDYKGFGSVNCQKAVAAGLVFRPVEVTAKDALAWWQSQPEERRATLRAGITPEREAEVLAAWHAREKNDGAE